MVFKFIGCINETLTSDDRTAFEQITKGFWVSVSFINPVQVLMVCVSSTMQAAKFFFLNKEYFL